MPLRGCGWTTGMFAVGGEPVEGGDILDVAGLSLGTILFFIFMFATVLICDDKGRTRPRVIHLTLKGELRKAGDSAVAEIEVGHALTDKEKKVSASDKDAPQICVTESDDGDREASLQWTRYLLRRQRTASVLTL